LGKEIIGISWEGANGIVGELQKENRPLIDINSPTGWKRLGTIIRVLVDQAGQDSYPLERAERRLLKEISARAVRPEDVRRLIGKLEAVIRETAHEDAQQGDHLRPHDPVRPDRGDD
jgi:hypothetical protein